MILHIQVFEHVSLHRVGLVWVENSENLTQVLCFNPRAGVFVVGPEVDDVEARLSIELSALKSTAAHRGHSPRGSKGLRLGA